MATDNENTGNAEIVERPEVTRAIEDYLATRLPGVIAVLARKFNIAQLLAASGTIRDMDINRIVMGEARIGSVILQGTSARLNSASAYLQNVRIIIELRLSVDWWYDIWVYDDSGTVNLGSMSFGMSIGNVRVPSLENIDLVIPSMSVQNIRANMPPITNLDLGGGSFNALEAKETALPAAGFQLSGLGIGNLSLSNVRIPSTYTKEASIQRFRPNSEIVLPSATASQMQVPSASAGNIQSGAISIRNATATRRGVSLNLGILGFTFWVQPVAHMDISTMLLQNVNLSANINQARIENVRVPIDVRGISMKGISLNQVNVNDVNL